MYDDEKYLEKMSSNGTFSSSDDLKADEEEYVIETSTCGNYIIDIRLNRDRVFVGIEQVKVDKNFYNYKDLINLEKKIRIPYPEESDE